MLPPPALLLTLLRWTWSSAIALVLPGCSAHWMVKSIRVSVLPSTLLSTHPASDCMCNGVVGSVLHRDHMRWHAEYHPVADASALTFRSVKSKNSVCPLDCVVRIRSHERHILLNMHHDVAILAQHEACLVGVNFATLRPLRLPGLRLRPSYWIRGGHADGPVTRYELECHVALQTVPSLT